MFELLKQTNDVDEGAQEEPDIDRLMILFSIVP